MATLTTSPAYDPIYQLESTDDVQGGPGNISNWQAQSLGNRDDFLKALIDGSFYAVRDTTTMVASYPSVISFTPIHGKLYITGGNAATYTLPPIASVEDGLVFAVHSTIYRTYIRAAIGENIEDDISNYPTSNQHTAWREQTLVVKKRPGATVWSVIQRIGDVPPGVFAYRDEVPSYNSAWIICNGATLSTSEHPRLFAQIGYSYGGSGSSFNVPSIPDASWGSHMYIHV